MKESKINYSDYKEISISDPLTQEGHGNTLSIKVVLPAGCQAKCGFCFGTCKFGKKEQDTFMSNLESSIERIKDCIPTRAISWDITGGEPTLFDELRRVLKKLNSAGRDDSCRSDNIVLTTNGARLGDLLYESESRYLSIVNISMHSFDQQERLDIFGTNDLPDFHEIKGFTSYFTGRGIKASAVCVLTADRLELCEDCGIEFKELVSEMDKSARDLGFLSLRIRLNYLNPDSKVLERFIKTEYAMGETESEQVGLYTKTLPTCKDFPIPVKIFKGVPDLVEAGVIGVEMIIDTDGKLYLDYEKKYPLQDIDLRRFNDHIYINRKIYVE